MNTLLYYMKLPPLVTEFEDRYLERMNAIGVRFFVCHIPFMVLLAFLNGTGPGLAAVLTTLIVAGPFFAVATIENRRHVSMVLGIAAMLMGGLLVHFGQGPIQIEMHFYFFVLLALLAVFANPLVIVTAAVTAALHHALLWYFLPASVFNYEAPLWVVGVHAAFVVLESVAACFIARSFFDNVIGLEMKVEARTAELERRNDDLRMVLNSVAEGLLTIDSSGIIHGERSKACYGLFGQIEAGQKFTDIVRRHNHQVGDWLDFSLEQVFDDVLPPEVTIAQLPKTIKIDDRHVSLSFYPVEQDGLVQNLTIVAADITAEMERQRLESNSRQLLSMLDGITRDKTGFLEFMHEADVLVEAIRDQSDGDIIQLQRRVHTLKGNAAIFGLQRLADACHDLETYIIHGERRNGQDCWKNLFACWGDVRGNLRRLISDGDGDGKYALSDSQYNELLLGLLNREPMEVLAPKVAAWRLDPTEQRLRRVADQARRLARQLGKGDIQVRVQSNGLLTEPKSWSPFWTSLIHVVRNAVDHGLETPEEREQRGKPPMGSLSLATTCDGGRFTITVSDDGRGVNWDKIGAVARARGIPADCERDLTEALFRDGLSTADAVTETSGRGIGLAALRSLCETMGGEVYVVSKPHEGTTFSFSFPSGAMAPEMTRLFRSYGVKASLETVCAG